MAKAKTPKRPRPKRPKQGYLAGMEPPSHPDVDQAAEIYDDAKNNRVALSKEEDEAKDNLIDRMKEHGLQLYKTPDGIIVTLTATSNVRTKRASDEKEQAETNGDGHEE